MPNVPPVPSTASVPSLRGARALHIAELVHAFWRERMRDAPSLDHALACILSGVELDAACREVAS